MRKANLARLLARRPDGIFLSDFEQGSIGQPQPSGLRTCEGIIRLSDVREMFLQMKDHV
jgi:hypothetical protein